MGFPSVSSHPDVKINVVDRVCGRGDYAGISCPFSEGAVGIVQ